MEWASNKIGRPDIAIKFESEIRELVRKADALHSILESKPTWELLSEMRNGLIVPLLQDFRRVFNNAVAKLRQHPDLADLL